MNALKYMFIQAVNGDRIARDMIVSMITLAAGYSGVRDDLLSGITWNNIRLSNTNPAMDSCMGGYAVLYDAPNEPKIKFHFDLNLLNWACGDYFNS